MKKIGSRQTKKIIAFLLCWFGIYCLYEALNFSPPIDLPKRKGDFGPALEDIRFNLVEESDPFVNISHLQTSLFYWKHQPVLKVPSNPIVFKGHDSSHKERFITFEYDCGGWNNVRLQIELLVSFAHLYNRTLVLPKPKKLYLLGKDGDVMSFDSFFDSSVINGSMINIMPWKEFDSLLYERGILFKNESAQQNDKRRESFLRNECYNPKHSPEHDVCNLK